MTAGYEPVSHLHAGALKAGCFHTITSAVHVSLQILEIKTESQDLIAALSTLSAIYPDNTPAARRHLRSTIEERGLGINEQFLEAAEGVTKVSAHLAYHSTPRCARTGLLGGGRGICRPLAVGSYGRQCHSCCVNVSTCNTPAPLRLATRLLAARRHLQSTIEERGYKHQRAVPGSSRRVDQGWLTTKWLWVDSSWVYVVRGGSNCCGCAFVHPE
jgi:hypothetical protein